jgi:ABC-type polysaccharide/polyol phosphate transport system ATPase subunit
MCPKENAKMKEAKEDYKIVVDNVYKTFNVYLDKANTMKEKLLFLFSRNRKEKREVLKGINLNIKEGEVVALIGTNGSGKSTLLKLLTKIIYPNKGKIETEGKLTSLLELGAGFHPDFSGRENIYFNASIFGLTRKEIDDRLEDIIEFSELRDFIDNPVRTYSSGMYMRLAFSVAINVDADILLIDEILSVGDEHFQNKCFEKMLELKKQGKTMVFVTHNMNSVKNLCDRAVWLYQGKIKMDGNTKEVVDEYIKATS